VDALLAERLGRLHRQFLDTAEQYQNLALVAVTDHRARRGEPTEWPHTDNSSDGCYFGLAPHHWRRILKNAGNDSAIGEPIYTFWLSMNDLLYEGALYALGNSSQDPQADYARLCEAKDRFLELAKIAAGHFDLPRVHALVNYPLEPSPAHRWVERLCAMPFVQVDTNEVVAVFHVPGDVFTASARAIEALDQ
jgi:hypothetical protein